MGEVICKIEGRVHAFYAQHHVYGQKSTETTGCGVTEDSHHLSVEDMMIPQGS